ncbi:MAG: methylated-DNA--[protein]-cysteine S-methyltransferase [Acidobacteria bacterium]|nr:MAG: methylated-DNA--[protein]-cysteine S-methyltransferase [Acidobacteriota bacterium]
MMNMVQTMGSDIGSRQQLVRRACAAVLSRPEAPWTSARLAKAGGTNPVQLQRAFRDILGLSPRDYIVACRRKRFLETVKTGQRVTDAIYSAGFGSPSRVYDAIRLPGMTPATYGRGGKGAHIRWMSGESPVGRVMVAATDRGLCFVQIGEEDEMRRALAKEFPLAEIDLNPSAALKPMLRAALAVASAKRMPAEFPIDIQGTAFQWRVWRALTKIPRGETRSYSDVARAIGRPSAVRAVARACATNPVALVVPCHRVVAKTGAAGGYRWGVSIKKKLLTEEKS